MSARASQTQMRAAAALVAVLAMLPGVASSQLKAELAAPSSTVRWGAPFALQMLLSNCGAPVPLFAGIDLLSLTTGRRVGHAEFNGQPSCAPIAVPVGIAWEALKPGWHFLQGGMPFTLGPTSPLLSTPLAIRFDHEFDLAYRGDRVQATMGTFLGYETCTDRSMRILDRESAGIPMPPANIRTPYEMFVFTGGGCSSVLIQRQLIALELPEKVGDVWLFLKEPGSTGYWSRLNGDVSPEPPTLPDVRLLGNVAILGMQVSGASVFAVVAVAYPQLDARGLDLQDMWWAGPAEAGWGLTIAKNGDRMFVAGYIYDAFGKPTWVVMPGGTWDPSTNVFSGDLFMPRSNPYTSYAGAGLDMRAPVGKGSLSFVGPDDGHFDYTLGDYAGGKTISRYKFAPSGKDKAPFAGIWWGGPVQQGWGLSVAQQGETVFATWYTYGQDFEPVWFFMPAGTRTADGKYSGTLYRTSGSTWPGAHYNGPATQVIAVGTLALDFDAKAMTGTMTAVVDGKTTVNPIVPFEF